MRIDTNSEKDKLSIYLTIIENILTRESKWITNYQKIDYLLVFKYLFISNTNQSNEKCCLNYE